MKQKLLAMVAGVAILGHAAAAGAQEIDLDAANAMAEQINIQLAADGADHRLAYMDYLLATPDEGSTQRTVFFNNRGNKQLVVQFVPGDTRRTWSGNDPDTIDWTYDPVDLTLDVSGGDQRDAIYDAVQTWEDVKCSAPGLTGSDAPFDTGFVEFLLGGDSVPAITGDIMQSGFLPPNFFLALGSSNILGVHFGFQFIDDNGDPTDINEDGFLDKALGDIYYNDGFQWSVDGNGGIDIESVALHETGHGLSQDHFGGAFTTPSGKLKFNPRAVMNATYFDLQREPLGTDKGGHCSLWASWPN